VFVRARAVAYSGEISADDGVPKGIVNVAVRCTSNKEVRLSPIMKIDADYLHIA
jgi:hypothetical protein